MTRPLLTTLLFGGTIVALVVLLDEALTLPIQIICVLLLLTQWMLLYRSTWFMQMVRRINVVKNLGALLMMLVILPFGRELGLLNSMVNLLFSGTVLWLFTANYNQSNWAKQVFIGIQLLVAVAFIYQQSLAWSLFSLICVITSLVALYISQFDQTNTSTNYALPNTMPVQFIKMGTAGVFVALLLFFIIPALEPFWKLPEQKQTATGLSDTMTPGDIASLASSNRLAFRGQFVELLESQQFQYQLHSQRYWRVLTLESFNGKTWSQATIRKHSSRALPTLAETRFSDLQSFPELAKLSIIAEPSQQQWLFSLGTATSNNRDVVVTSDTRLLHKEKLTKRTKYEFSVHSTTNNLPLNAADRSVNLQLPNSGFERTRELAQQFWSQAKSASSTESSTGNPITEFNQLIFNYFRSEGFVYTLKPALLQGEHLDDFLFNTKQGFCSHYASAHAAMLRIVGVPARVVTGYHGGEYNAVGDYYNVYDSSAHAWVEYSEDGNGWTRIDPTSVVSPNRIEFGLERGLQDQSDEGINQTNFVKDTPWLNQIRQQLQSLDYYWTVWVLDYDKTKRDNRIRDFFGSAKLWGPTLGILVVIGVIIVAVWLFRQRNSNRISLEQQLIFRMYKAVCNKNKSPNRINKSDINWTLTLNEHEAHLSQLYPKFAGNIADATKFINEFVFRNRNQLSTRQAYVKIDALCR